MNDDGSSSPDIITRRAYRLIVFLVRRRERGEMAPAPAIEIAPRIGVPAGQSHETKRRRVREAAVKARELLRREAAPNYLCAGPAGYWITIDRGELNEYLGRRRRAGRRQFAEVGQVSRSPAADAVAGQEFLFAAGDGPQTRMW